MLRKNLIAAALACAVAVPALVPSHAFAKPSSSSPFAPKKIMGYVQKDASGVYVVPPTMTGMPTIKYKVMNAPFDKILAPVAAMPGKAVQVVGSVTAMLPGQPSHLEVSYVIGENDTDVLVYAAPGNSKTIGKIKQLTTPKIIGLKLAIGGAPWYEIKLAGGKVGYVRCSDMPIAHMIMTFAATPGATGSIPQ
jgi:hypothetical protein